VPVVGGRNDHTACTSFLFPPLAIVMELGRELEPSLGRPGCGGARTRPPGHELVRSSHGLRLPLRNPALNRFPRLLDQVVHQLLRRPAPLPLINADPPPTLAPITRAKDWLQGGEGDMPRSTSGATTTSEKHRASCFVSPLPHWAPSPMVPNDFRFPSLLAGPSASLAGVLSDDPSFLRAQKWPSPAQLQLFFC